MTDSKAKPVNVPVFPRNRKHLWLDAAGRVVKAKKEESVQEVKKLHWEANVVDAATDSDVGTFPTLQGEVEVRGNADSQHVVQLAYLNKCRFIDGEKPDIELLQKNLNAGIWEVHVKIPELA